MTVSQIIGKIGVVVILIIPQIVFSCLLLPATLAFVPLMFFYSLSRRDGLKDSISISFEWIRDVGLFPMTAFLGIGVFK